MIHNILITTILISFFVTLSLTPYWIRKAKQIGLTWDNMNKPSTQKIPGSGGVIVTAGFILGAFAFIAYTVFVLGNTNSHLIETLALLNVIMILSSLGFIDDLLGWRKGGLSKRSRIILIFLAAIPLIAINAGKSRVSLPFMGTTELGIIYPLFLIPLGIVGATIAFNMVAGFNGLEAGQGIILLSAFAIVSHFTGSPQLVTISLTMASALLAFLFFNFYPAKVFPGDALTYSVGGLLAIIAILGDFEKIAVFFFIPYIIEVGLKSRGIKKQSFGKPQKDCSLDLRYDKIYSLTHLSIFLMKTLGFRPTERKVTFSIYAFQIFVIILGFLIFKQGIFIQ